MYKSLKPLLILFTTVIMLMTQLASPLAALSAASMPSEKPNELQQFEEKENLEIDTYSDGSEEEVDEEIPTVPIEESQPLTDSELESHIPLNKQEKSIGAVEAEQTDTVQISVTQMELDPFAGTSSPYFKVTKRNVVVYDNRGGGLNSVGHLREGEVYPRVRDYGNWHQIQYGDHYGFVRKASTVPHDGQIIKNKQTTATKQVGSFTTLSNVTVSDNTSGSLVPFATISQGQTYPIASDYGNWWRVIYANRVGYVQKSHVKVSFLATDKYFRAESNLPIYENREDMSKEIGRLKQGQVYPRVSDSGNWHRIQFDNGYGYVPKSGTSAHNGSGLKNVAQRTTSGTRKITALQNVTIYDNTSGSLVPFGEIKKNQSYSIVSDYGNWWRVVYANRTGYINKQHVRVQFLENDRYFTVMQNTPIYDNSGASLVAIGTLQKGQTFPTFSDYGNWWRVKFGDGYGFVNKQNTAYVANHQTRNWNTNYKNQQGNKLFTIEDTPVYDNSSGLLVPMGEIKKGNFFPVVSDYGSWWRIIYLDRVGYVHKSAAQLANQNEMTAFSVTEDASVSILDKNKRKYVATLKAGEIFEKVNEHGDWIEIKYGNQRGFVWKPVTKEAYFTFNKKTTNKALLSLIDVPLYSDIKQTDVIAVVEAGETLLQTKKINESWHEVLLAGRTLYVESKHVIEHENISFSEAEHPYFKSLKSYLMSSPMIGDDLSTAVNETVEHANLIMSGYIRFPLFDQGKPMDYRKGIDWTKGKGIESQHERSFLRQLHGLFYINDLVEAYHVVGDEKYIRKGYEIIYDWKTNNPYHNPKHYMAWHDEGTAHRLSTLVNFFEAGKSILKEHEKKELFELMVFHADLLSDEHFYSYNTNHGMFQDEALIVFSKYFYDTEVFSKYYDLAIERLQEYFDSLISSEGVHLEHSPSYHQTIARSLKSYSEALSHIGDKEAAGMFTDKYNSMAHYATHIIKPDGVWPLIADTYRASNISTNLWSNMHYRYAATKGRFGEAPRETNVVFPDGDYAIFRDSWNNQGEGAYIFFTAAYHTEYHKHSDDLSLWIYDGQDIITEAGPYSYAISDPITNYAYSSFAHNTLIVDDQGLPRVDGKYDLTYLESYNIDNSLHPSATGVNKRFDGVTHRRNVNYDKQNRIIEVNDEITSTDKHNYKLLWHLAPEIIPEIDHENSRIMLKKAGEIVMTIHLSSEQALKIKSVYGGEDPLYKSWTFDNRKQNGIIDVHTLMIETNNNSATISTTFELPNR